MILVDTGPLVALLDRNDPNHARCRAILQNAPAGPMLTTLPCLTEAMYFKALMEKYQDAPMDFADASLVAAAEAVGITRIFTLDSHFYVYLIHDKTPFEVLV